MAGDAVASVRPVLKGRHAQFMKKHMAIAVGLSLAGVYLTKVFVNDKRKAAYAEFYRCVPVFIANHIHSNAFYEPLRFFYLLSIQ